jgi:hypothetical protein
MTLIYLSVSFAFSSLLKTGCFYSFSSIGFLRMVIESLIPLTTFKKISFLRVRLSPTNKEYASFVMFYLIFSEKWCVCPFSVSQVKPL